MNYIFYVIIFICSIFSLYHISKMSSKFIKFLISFCSGLVMLILINLTTKYTGVNIPVNYYTLGICSVLGIPGNLLILAVNYILI